MWPSRGPHSTGLHWQEAIGDAADALLWASLGRPWSSSGAPVPHHCRVWGSRRGDLLLEPRLSEGHQLGSHILRTQPLLRGVASLALAVARKGEQASFAGAGRVLQGDSEKLTDACKHENRGTTRSRSSLRPRRTELELVRPAEGERNSPTCLSWLP